MKFHWALLLVQSLHSRPRYCSRGQNVAGFDQWGRHLHCSSSFEVEHDWRRKKLEIAGSCPPSKLADEARIGSFLKLEV